MGKEQDTQDTRWEDQDTPNT